jgi:hypothetical protein
MKKGENQMQTKTRETLFQKEDNTVKGKFFSSEPNNLDRSTWAHGRTVNGGEVYVCFITTGSYQLFYLIPREKWYTQGISRRCLYEFLERMARSDISKEDYDPQGLNQRDEKIEEWANRIFTFYEGPKNRVPSQFTKTGCRNALYQSNTF